MTAPRVTPDDLQGNIASEHYFTAHDGIMGLAQRGDSVTITPALQILTFCVLVLRNGTKIVGINYGAIDPTQNDPVRGRTDARADAIRQVWPLMGYALRDQLFQRNQPVSNPDLLKD